MRRSMIVSLLAAGALSGVAAAGAAAAPPRYLACNKAAKVGKAFTGAYANKTCSETSPEHNGKYEVGALTKLPSKVKGTVGAVNIYLYNPIEHKIEGHFECSSGKAAGTITSASDGTVSATYKGCKATGQLAGPCNSKGKKPGEVVTEALDSRLVWLNEAETEPGIQYVPATEGGSITSVVCAGGAETAELVGAMTGRIAPTSEISKNQTISFVGSATTGEPEFAGQWAEGTFLSEPLLSNLKGVKTFSGVPTSQDSVISEKGPAVEVGA
jgi:hypothetical protein